MFEVNVNGKQYRVAFKYFVDESVDQRDMYYDIESGRDAATLARYTRAQLYLMRDGEKIAVAYADVACPLPDPIHRERRHDQFSKDRGRKEALVRLMDTYRALTPDEIEYKKRLPSCKLQVVLDWDNLPNFDDKDIRTAFWRAYFGRQIDDRIPMPNRQIWMVLIGL